MDYPQFFIKFIDAVHAQFIYDEEGLDGSIMDHDSSLSDDLRMLLTTFKSRLNELLLAKGNNLTPAQKLVDRTFESLESFLWKWTGIYVGITSVLARYVFHSTLEHS